MIARFDDFELDTGEGRLCRNGEALRIEKLPLDLLALFLRRPAEILSREEIAAALWGGTVHVDEEHGINTAVRKLRHALGDDSAKPRYVETVVRRGYRFCAAVECLDPALPSTAPPEPRRHWQPVAIVLTLMAAMAALAAYRGRDDAPALHWTPLTHGIHAFSRLASDGRSIYWTETAETACQPYSVLVSGGPAAPV